MSDLPLGYLLTDDQSQIDAAAAHAYLTRSYWSPGISLELVSRALENSLAVAIMFGGEQIAMARVVTDKATFAYLADVYVLEEHRGKGLSKTMVLALHNHPELQGLRRWVLFTVDAHWAYEKLGWTALAHPERGMERVFPDVYNS
ncbi:GNAT family N-acetyltransferase [Altererythrobacter sp. ZODW24]|uniref:GNAT family N-acetyltransferase n=1 Tax=Altererythrobacter sp. ZODW24 TaxID=2185142 RepID=UPI000DF807EF|nr:GNAT family N-acetyltransferase [Altererythrobacter sp. ZODW24]